MKKLAVFLIMLAGILWGCLGLFVRKLNGYGIESMEIVLLRAGVTCVVLFLFLLFYDYKLLQIKVKDIWCFLGTGILSILFFNFCYFKAITMTSLSMAAVLLYTAPAIVMVLSATLFKEKITVTKILALCMTIFGCALVTGILEGSGKGSSVFGILVGLGAGLGYALYSIFGRYALQRGYHSLTITFYTFLITTIGGIILADTEKIVKVMTVSIPSFVFCILFGIIGTVIPYLTYTLGLKYVENSKASIIASVEPVTATLLGFIVYHEKLNFANIVGVILVLGALIVQTLGNRNYDYEQ